MLILMKTNGDREINNYIIIIKTDSYDLTLIY